MLQKIVKSKTPYTHLIEVHAYPEHEAILI